MHTASYWKGVRNTFTLLMGIALIVFTFLTWNADLVKIFAGHVQVSWLMEPFRWLAVVTFGAAGGVMIFHFLEESFDFDLHFYRKKSTVEI